MRFGLLSEGDVPKGMTHFHRYNEIIDEVCLADKLGFDFWGTSEQHFFFPVVSAPETLYGAVAARTSRIKLRHMSVLMLTFNHPIRIAERLATLDIISGGRVEFGTARSNNPEMLKIFGIEPSETKQQWRETLEVTIRALVEDPFEFSGKYYNIPPVSVTPKLFREQLFPVSVIASSIETFDSAGQQGLGVMTNDSYLGWEHIQEGASRYRKAIGSAQPFAPYPVNDTLSYAVFTANCDVTQERAVESSRHIAKGFFGVAYDFYSELAKKAPGSYGDLSKIQKMAEKRDDLDYLMDCSPSIIIGTPDRFITAIEKLQAMGFDEVIFRLDGYGHEQNKRAISLIAKYVIPHFKSPASVNRAPLWEHYGPVPDLVL